MRSTDLRGLSPALDVELKRRPRRLRAPQPGDTIGNDAGMGFLGSIVPDEEEVVSNMLLAQFGSIPARASATGRRPISILEQMSLIVGQPHANANATGNTSGVHGAWSHAREKRQAVRRIVPEIYSPPRVTAEIVRSRNRHLLPGFAMDLAT